MVCTTQRVTRDGVPMLANPFNWRVRWPRPARVPLFSLGLRYLEVHVATAGGWLTRYRPREVRNSIYRYRKIHIDYRSKFLYRFISPISIIYGNTTAHGLVLLGARASAGTVMIRSGFHMYIGPALEGLTHWGLVMHMCINELGHHWSKW